MEPSLTDLRAQLQAALGNAFLIERELGGGGMSRVFVADEVRLSRRVAIKVLSPELAQGLNAERFEREILLAASLQQANIVPVLAAGEVDGLPYFTMPFVEGESLRSRLGGAGMPIDDVLAILRDVTKALAYAHSRGIVHRDIKPDNVLLSGGTAVVTDFGIAKALSASRAPESGGTLTQLGTSIGTPAYMAPEQVAGDPDIDHRVDLYALGCMAQELLTGKSPFADRTPQKMLAGHLSETPPAIGTFRSDVPAGLTLLIGALLRKDPADRPASAAEVLQALNAVSTASVPTLSLDAPGMLPKVAGLYLVATAIVLIVAKAAIVGIGLPPWVFTGALVIMLLGIPALLATWWVKRVARRAAPALTPGGTASMARTGTMTTLALRANPHLSWRRTARMGAVTLGVFVLMVAGFMGLRAAGIGPWGSLMASGSISSGARILLADFTSAPGDSALAKVMGEAVRAAMSQSTAARMVDKVDVAQVLVQMQQRPDTRLGDDNLKEVATRLGAAAVLRGQLAPAGTGYAVSIELMRASDGVQLASFQGTSEGNKDLLPVVDELAQKLRGRLGESLKAVQSAVPLERATTWSLEALQKYSDASFANDVTQDYETARRLLREALAIDSTFAMAWRKLTAAMINSGITGPAIDSTLEQSRRYADALTPLERNLVLGSYYSYHRRDYSRGKAIEAYRAAYKADSSNTIAINQLSSLFTDRRQYDSALRYMRRKVANTPNVASYTQLASALINLGVADEAARILDSLAAADTAVTRTRPWNLSKHALFDLRQQRDSMDWLVRRAMDGPSAQLRAEAIGALQGQEVAGGRLKEAVELEARDQQAKRERGADPGFAVQQITNDVLFLGRTEAGVQAMDRMVASPLWQKLPPAERPHLQLATGYALAGRPDKARQMMQRFAAESPAAARAASSRPARDLVDGQIALAEKRYPEALKAFRAADVADDGLPTACEACMVWNLARTFDAAGQADSAVAMYERYLAIPAPLRDNDRPLAVIYKRLGELYESTGDKAKALRYYGKFVELWKAADAELQPTVSDVKKRMQALERVGG